MALRDHNELEKSDNPWIFKVLINYIAVLDILLKDYLENTVLYLSFFFKYTKWPFAATFGVCQEHN